MAYIGDIYIPAISELDTKDATRDSETVRGIGAKNEYIIQKRHKGYKLKISGILYNDGNKHEDEYSEDLLAIQDRDTVYNFLNYVDSIGFVQVDNIRTPKDAKRANMREYFINGKFFPNNEYIRYIPIPVDIESNEYAQGGPSQIPLPCNSYNVKCKGPLESVNIIPNKYQRIDDGKIEKLVTSFTSSEWTAIEGSLSSCSWNSENNELDIISSSDTSINIVNNITTTNDGIYSVEVKFNGNDVELEKRCYLNIFCNTNDVSCYGLYLYKTGSFERIHFVKKVGTTETTLFYKTFDNFIDYDKWYKLSIRKVGNTLSGYLNDIFCGSIIDTCYVSGYLGIRSYVDVIGTNSTNVSFRNLKYYKEIQIYQPFPLFYHGNVSSVDGATTTFDDVSYGQATLRITTQNKYARWQNISGNNIPRGGYKLKLRVKDSNVSSDIAVTITGSVSGTILSTTLSTGGTSWTQIETSAFSLNTVETITYEIKKSTATTNTIDIDNIYLVPLFSPAITYDCDSENGECRIYDSVTSLNSDRTTWKRVFNVDHDFSGDIIIENGIYSWYLAVGYEISSSNNYLLDKINNVKYRFYNYEYNSTIFSLNNIRILNINSTYIELEWIFEQGGASSSDSLEDTVIDNIKITPTNFIIKESIKGSIKHGWFLYRHSIATTFDVCTKVNNTYKDITDPGASSSTSGNCGINFDRYDNVIFSRNIAASFHQYSTSNGILMLFSSTIPQSNYIFSLSIIPIQEYYNVSNVTQSIDEERTFFKDDVTNNLSNLYSSINGAVSDWTFDTTNKEIYYNGSGMKDVYNKYLIVNNGKYSIDLKWGTLASVHHVNMLINCNISPSCHYYTNIIRTGTSAQFNIGKILNGVNTTLATSSSTTISDNTYYHVDFIKNGTSLTVYLNGTQMVTITDSSINNNGYFVIQHGTANFNMVFKNYTYSPSIAYSDNFASNTSGRYVKAYGSNLAYGSGNLAITSNAADSTTAYLRSYNFESGSYKCKISIPASNGTNTDFVSINIVSNNTTDASYDQYMLKLTRSSSDSWTPTIVKRIKGVETILATGSTMAADGLTMIFEIEYDAIRNELYCFIYNSAGVRPITPTIKAYDYLYKYGRFGFSFKNAYAGGSRIIYIDDIEIRARCLVGETNVMTTENFYFKDEFNEDSLNRYSSSTPASFTYDSTNKEVDIAITANSNYDLTLKNAILGNGTYEMEYAVRDYYNTTTGTANFFICASHPSSYSSGNVYNIKITQSATSLSIGYYWYLNGVYSYLTGFTYNGTINLNDVIKANLVYNNGLFTHNIYQNGTLRLTGSYTYSTIFEKGYVGIGCRAFSSISDNGQTDITYWSFDGTRYYYKPILRGTQIGEYNNGTNNLLATSYTDDMNWNTTSEYTIAYGSYPTYDETIPSFKSTTGGNKYNYLNNLSFTNLHLSADVKVDATGVIYLIFRWLDGVVGSSYCSSAYWLRISSSILTLWKSTDGSTGTAISSDYNHGISVDTWFKCRITAVDSTINVYLNDILLPVITVTDTSFTKGFIGINYGGATTMVRNLQVTGYETNAIDGSSICIGGVPHGARFDTEENISIVKGFEKGVYNVITRNVGTIESTSSDYCLDAEFLNISDSTYLNLNGGADRKMTVGYQWGEDADSILIDSNEDGDIISLKVKRRNESTHNTPACFVNCIIASKVTALEGNIGYNDAVSQTYIKPALNKTLERRD